MEASIKPLRQVPLPKKMPSSEKTKNEADSKKAKDNRAKWVIMGLNKFMYKHKNIDSEIHLNIF